MTSLESKIASLLAGLIASLLATSAAAENAELKIQPDWQVLVENQVPFKPALDPDDILRTDDLDKAFDRASGWWIMTVGPLRSKLTVFQLKVLKTTENDANQPEITIAIPNAKKTYSIPVTRFNDMDALEPGDTVRNIYRQGIERGLEPVEHNRRWLTAFFSAEHMLDVLLGGSPIEDVEVHPPIVRALTVYADAVAELVGHTEWFGTPSNFQERLRLIDHVEQQAAADNRLAGSGSIIRLRNSAARLRTSGHQLYGRLWRNIKKGYPIKCNTSFPDAVYLYRTMDEMTDNEYESLKNQLSITKTIVLNEAIRCFRELMTRDAQAAWFWDVVVEGEFEGKTGPVVLAELQDAAINELYRFSRTYGDKARDGDCDNSEGESARQLCDSLKFLNEIESRLEEEPRNVVRNKI